MNEGLEGGASISVDPATGVVSIESFPVATSEAAANFASVVSEVISSDGITTVQVEYGTTKNIDRPDGYVDVGDVDALGTTEPWSSRTAITHVLAEQHEMQANDVHNTVNAHMAALGVEAAVSGYERLYENQGLAWDGRDVGSGTYDMTFRSPGGWTEQAHLTTDRPTVEVTRTCEY